MIFSHGYSARLTAKVTAYATWSGAFAGDASGRLAWPRPG
jgi:hypothetical protein